MAADSGLEANFQVCEPALHSWERGKGGKGGKGGEEIGGSLIQGGKLSRGEIKYIFLSDINFLKR